MGMNEWLDPLSRENLLDFYNIFAPAAYRSVYKMVGDTTRTENVLLEAFSETYRERNTPEGEDPVALFGAVLQKKAMQMAAKYPVPENYSFSIRSLDEFTQTTLYADIIRKIDSLPFKAYDAIASTTVHRMSGSSTVPRITGSIASSGVSILLIIQLLIVGLIISAVTYLGAMSVFGVSDSIPDYRVSAEQNTDEKLVAALQYLPLKLQGITVYSDKFGVIPEPADSETTASGDTGEETTTLDTKLMATRG